MERPTVVETFIKYPGQQHQPERYNHCDERPTKEIHTEKKADELYPRTRDILRSEHCPQGGQKRDEQDDQRNTDSPGWDAVTDERFWMVKVSGDGAGSDQQRSNRQGQEREPRQAQCFHRHDPQTG